MPKIIFRPNPTPPPFVPPTPARQVLTFTALENNVSVQTQSNVSETGYVFKVSYDGGSSWEIQENVLSISLPNVGDSAMVKGNNIDKATFYATRTHMKISGPVAASGDLTSLLVEDGGDVPMSAEIFSEFFKNCQGLRNAPELPSTTLARNCYKSMFYGCTSLTAAPALPATTLVSGCYSDMFSGCTKLNYIEAMFLDTPTTTYTSNWVLNVSTQGTFVKSSLATWDAYGSHAIPTGWTVQQKEP